MVLYEDRPINSIEELLKFLKDDMDEVPKPIWFRGHAKKSWDLMPSIFRPETTKNEKMYFKEFKKDALLLVEPIPTTQYEWLFIMRHNHIPTRLLDWTESAIIALYFALFDEDVPEPEEDSALWVLSPLKLNNNFTELEEEGTLPTFEEDKDVTSPYTPEKYSDLSERAKQIPLAILAPRNTKRMQAQQSVFTIHHKIEEPLEQIKDTKHVWRYIIPIASKDNLRKELRILGMNKLQVYPELPKISEKIKEDEKYD